MDGRTLSDFNVIEEALGDDQSSNVAILAVGEPQDWIKQGKVLPKGQIAFVSFAEVTGEALEHFSPAVVYSPVLAPSFDCIELALLLNQLGYEGPYRAVAQHLPKPDLIEREVRQLCRWLDFRILLAD